MSNGNGVAIKPDDPERNELPAESACERCGDSLWVSTNSEEREDSSLVPCECSFGTIDQRVRLRTYAQLGYLEQMKFGGLRKNHRVVEDVESFLKAKELAKSFAADPQGWLVLEGASGSGKTHFAAAIVNDLANRGVPTKYVSALEIPDLLRRAWYNNFGDLEIDEFTLLLDCPVLVIDDFGAHSTADWVEAKIDQLLTYRFNSRAPTVIALAKPRDELPERHSTKFGDYAWTRIVTLTRVAREISGLPPTMLNAMSFDEFKPEGSPTANHAMKESLKLGLSVAKDFVEHPGNSKPWLYIQGNTGVGKTHLAVAIAGASIKGGLEVGFWSLPEFLDRLRQTYSNRNENQFFTLFDYARNVELLVLDDFGAQQMTDWSLEKLHQLLSYRHDRRLRTVIAGHYKIWDPPENAGDEADQRMYVEIPESRYDSTRPERDQSAKSQLLAEHQWLSIISRLKHHKTVTVSALNAPDYRNLGV